MTVSYSKDVATCRGFGCFLKLLARWRGSIYKLIWKDLLAFLLLYYTLNFTYRFILTEPQKRTFEDIVNYCYSSATLIPLSFLLGFFVSIVMERWWDQYMTIPWPDTPAVYVSCLIHGEDDTSRLMRRTIMRYICLCLTLVFRDMAPRVKRRFPTLSDLVAAGHLEQNEMIILEKFQQDFPKQPNQWMPILWAANIITYARYKGHIREEISKRALINSINNFRSCCGALMSYEAINIPLVYTQVVTLAVYTYFLGDIFASQWVENPRDMGKFNTIDIYFPFFTMLEFFFYMGWLKVAETLIYPFGDDDDDFEVNWIIDRNFTVSYLIVDDMHQFHPELVKDKYFDQDISTQFSTLNNASKATLGRNVSFHPSSVSFKKKPQSKSFMSITESLRQRSSELQVSSTDTSKSQFSYLKMPYSQARFLSDTTMPISTEGSLDGESKIQIEPEASDAEYATVTPQISETYRPTLEDIFVNTKVPGITDDSSTDQSQDAFERLRELRQQERQMKHIQHYIRNLGKAAEIIKDLYEKPPVVHPVPKEILSDLLLKTYSEESLANRCSSEEEQSSEHTSEQDEADVSDQDGRAGLKETKSNYSFGY